MADTAVALRELRAVRRRKRVANIEWFEALYRVYLTGIVGIVIVLFISSWLGDAEVSPTGLADLLDHGPAAIGLGAAIALAVGLRSGGRGGPLALEPAEVRYVLMAPVDRRLALQGTAFRQLRFAAFTGAVAGAIGGQLAHRRLEGNPAAWIAIGAAVGITLGFLLVGTALVASGLRLRRWQATLLGAAILAWAVADLAGKVPAPTTLVGSLALWPLRVHLVDLVAPLAALALAAIGLRLLGRQSLEAAERRTGLVGQLRFAATVQDLRTVIVLRRQLAEERPRGKPWFKLPGKGHHLPVFRRGWHGLLRFPAQRLARLALLGIAAGLATVGAYHGTSPLVVVSGLALYLAGLDAIEPLSQEIDQSDRADSVPIERGVLLLRHVAVPAVVMVFVGLVGGGVAVAVEHSSRALGLGLILLLPAVWGGAAGAAVSVTMGAPEPFKDGQLLPPEMAGMKVAARTAWPLIVAVIGSLPVLAAQRADLDGHDGTLAAAQAAIAAMIVVAGTVAWVRFREPAKVWWKQFLEEGQNAAKERQSTRGTSR